MSEEPLCAGIDGRQWKGNSTACPGDRVVGRGRGQVPAVLGPEGGGFPPR
jgi:hypothetical protein